MMELEVIKNKIHEIRGHKVMLDFDLALMYTVENRILKQAVRRNINRFPEDFMFVLSENEINQLVSQFVIPSKSFLGGSQPFAFTEQGIAMLSSVLNSETAIEVNIQIIRIFSRMREVFLTHKDIVLKLEQLEKRLIQQDTKTNKHEEEIQIIFNVLKKLLNQPQEPRRKIGF